MKRLRYGSIVKLHIGLTLDHFQSLSITKEEFKSKLAAKDKIADENNIIQAQKGVAFISIMTVLTGPSSLIIKLVWRSYFVN